MPELDLASFCRPYTLPDAFTADPKAGLEEAGRNIPGPLYLLAQADDGVIWGRFENGSLLTRGRELRLATLQAARLFGPQAELFIWRTNEGFAARLIDAEPPSSEEDPAWFDELHLLWGQPAGRPQDGFTPLEEGAEGLRHAPPLELVGNERAALRVRHYLDYDEMGQAYISFSRLVDLERA